MDFQANHVTGYRRVLACTGHGSLICSVLIIYIYIYIMSNHVKSHCSPVFTHSTLVITAGYVRKNFPHLIGWCCRDPHQHFLHFQGMETGACSYDLRVETNSIPRRGMLDVVAHGHSEHSEPLHEWIVYTGGLSSIHQSFGPKRPMD